MASAPGSLRLPKRAGLLPALYASHATQGFLTVADVERIAREVQVPVAEAWSVANGYPEFRFDAPADPEEPCGGLACALTVPAAERAGATGHCKFRCYEAPVRGPETVPGEELIKVAGPVLAPDVGDWNGFEQARRLGRPGTRELVERAGVRGRGGAYFPVARKWQTALDQARPVALVMNAEEGEPGVFKDRALLALRPRRVVEGLAIAASVLEPALTVVFINGGARQIRTAFERLVRDSANSLGLGNVAFVSGGGGYVLGEDTTMVNAIEGQRPVPRPRPPYPAEAGVFGMPTVVSNVESFAAVSVAVREGANGYRSRGTADAPGTKLFSLSGAATSPGVYELDIGTTVEELAGRCGASTAIAALVGGPSGGFLPAGEFRKALAPGVMHETGAVLGAGGVTFLGDLDQLRTAVEWAVRFNREESCGKCTPCREGTYAIEQALAGHTSPDGLWDTVRFASLCGLGQMATGPARSALHFWPEVFG